MSDKMFYRLKNIIFVILHQTRLSRIKRGRLTFVPLVKQARNVIGAKDRVSSEGIFVF